MDEGLAYLGHMAVPTPVLDVLRGSLCRFQAVQGTIIEDGQFLQEDGVGRFRGWRTPRTFTNDEKRLAPLIEDGLNVRNRTIELLELNADTFIQVSEYNLMGSLKIQQTDRFLAYAFFHI
jgi:hypothetical protein